MTGVPIDEVALKVAERTYVSHIEGRLDTSLSDDIRVLVSTYLGAVGARVEQEKGVEGGIAYRHERVVLPWRPLTDREEER